MTRLIINRYKYWALAVFFSLIVNSQAIANPPQMLQVAIDDSCPFTCLNYKYKGIFPDLIEAILSPYGYQFKYLIRPWKRSIFELSSGKLDIVGAVDPLSYPNFLYPAETFYTESACFYGTKGEDWKYQGVMSLKGKKIGLINYGSIGIESSIFYPITSNENTLKITYISPTANNILDRALQSIHTKRIHFIPLNTSAMQFNLSLTEKISLMNNLENYGCMSKKMALKVALSPNKPQSKTIAKLLDEGIIKLKRNGGYQKILAKYQGTNANLHHE